MYTHQPALFFTLRGVISVLFFLQVSIRVSGQGTGYKLIPPQYELERIELNNKEELGLLNDMIEDREGYLWLTGLDGLHVFDGHHTVTYKNGSKEYKLAAAPGINEFRFLSPQNRGAFWMLEGFNKIIEFNPRRRSLSGSFQKTTEAKATYWGLSLTTASDHFFLQINETKDLVSLCRQTSKGDVEKLYERPYAGGNFRYHLIGNNHWLLNDRNIVRLSWDGEKVKQYAYPPAFSTIFSSSTNNTSFYFTDTRQENIYTWNAQTDKLEIFLTVPPAFKGILQAFIVEGDKVYCGNNLRFFVIDKATKTIQNLSTQFVTLARQGSPDGLSAEMTKIFRQKDGDILVETTANIYRLKKKVPDVSLFRQQVTVENPDSALISFRQLAEDENQNIYASHYKGIAKKANGSGFVFFPVKQYLMGSVAASYSLHYWKGYLLWNNVKIDLATGKHKYMFDSTFSGHCTQYLKNDSLWLFKWRTKTLHCYDLKRNILKSYAFGIDLAKRNYLGEITDVNDMTGDASGQNLWISSREFGLCLVSKKGKLIMQFTRTQLGTSDDNTTDLELVGDQLWYGCTDGLGVLNTTTGKSRIYKNPAIINGHLKDRTVFSIQKDPNGNFYLGSNHGLLYFDTKTKSFRNLVDEHPLSNLEFNRASVFRSSDGRYYFGTTDGLYSFKADELEFHSSSYAIKPIKLYGISIFNSQQNSYHYLSENLDSLGKLILDPNDIHMEFSFSVPEFARDIYYKYRIKGQLNTWTAYKPDNTVLISGLQSGNYTLEVMASTSLSDENARHYSLPIEMKQVWYKKIWVIVLFSISGIGLLIGILRYRFNERIQQQKDLADLRTKISADLHDDVGTLLAGLAMQSQMLTYTAKEEQKESLNEISSMSRDAMERMRDTVWAMDSRKDKYENLIDRMRAFAEKNLAMKNMTHQFIISDVDAKKFINPEKRQTIYLIFKEAITNIVKHSNGKHVVIRFTEEKNKTTLVVEDNGTLRPKSSSDGLGLGNMKMRAEKLGGTLTARFNDGFVVALEIP